MIFDIKRFALNDGPGIRTTVFLKGCPLRCFWCHNPESIDPEPELLHYPAKCTRCYACVEVCPNSALNVAEDGAVQVDAGRCEACGTCAQACPTGAMVICGERMTAEQAFDVVAQDKIFYDESGGGVTISGGEPLARPDFVLALARMCRGQGIHVAVDTSGFVADSEVFAEVARAVDLALFDVKAVDEELHRRGTGVGNGVILQNLRDLARTDGGPEVVVRRPVVPPYNDGDDELGRFVELLEEVGRPPVELLPYHELGRAKPVRAGGWRSAQMAQLQPERALERALEWQRALADAGIQCRVLDERLVTASHHAKAT